MLTAKSDFKFKSISVEMGDAIKPGVFSPADIADMKKLGLVTEQNPTKDPALKAEKGKSK